MEEIKKGKDQKVYHMKINYFMSKTSKTKARR